MSNLSQSSPFDSIRHEDDQGEYWLARELMPVLGYYQWRQFSDAIERAMIAQQNSQNDVAAHFWRSVAKTQGRPKEDYRLSRYGCYLTAMNGDPRKPEIAAAQNYFVIKTREAEVIIPQQSERLRELELQLAIAQAQNSTVLAQERLMLTSKTIAEMHGFGQLALIKGCPDAVITEKEVVRETVMVDQNLNPVATFDGMGITEIAKRLGFTGKNANQQCKKWLQSIGVKDEDWRQEMTAHATSKLPREIMPKLKQLWAQRKGNRQMLIGE